MHIKVQWVLAGPWNSLWDADAAGLCTILLGTGLTIPWRVSQDQL